MCHGSTSAPWTSFRQNSACFVQCSDFGHKQSFAHGWASRWTSRVIYSRVRSFKSSLCVSHCLPSPFRERREHRVFKELIRIVPGLEERFMRSSEEEIGMISDLVIVLLSSYFSYWYPTPRYKRALRVLDLMIQKASKVRLSTGSHRRASRWILHLRATAK